MTIKVGDTVVMSKAAIKRTNHSEFARTFRGVVIAVFGGTCDVQADSGVRGVPVANLTPVREVLDTRTGRTSKIIMDL
jgi:AICAR transformylase/IMP cyclohydrolase PurH